MRQYFPYFERAGVVDAIVEFVANASRVRIFVPKESCVVTLLLAGVDCPMPSRPSPRGGGAMLPAEPFGEEACNFLKELVLHHDVKIKADTFDRGGNLIGWLFVGQGDQQKNVAIELVNAGYARLHSSADRSPYYQALKTAEEQATAANLKIWSLPRPEPEKNAEPAAEAEAEEKEGAQLPFKPVEVLSVSPSGAVAIRWSGSKENVKETLSQLSNEMQQSPPLPGSYTPKKGDICAYRTSMNTDSAWERARIDNISGGKISLTLIDSARTLVLASSAQLASCPDRFSKIPAQATEAVLAGIHFPKDEEYRMDAVAFLEQLIKSNNGSFEAAVVSKATGNEGIILRSIPEGDSEEAVDIGRQLLANGVVTVEKRNLRRLLPVPSARDEFTAAQQEARQKRLNIWRYGHFEEEGSDEENDRPFRR